MQEQRIWIMPPPCGALATPCTWHLHACIHASLALQEMLAEGLDLVVSTPGRLAEHLARGNLELSACRTLVLDECDVLLGACVHTHAWRGGARAHACGA